MLKIAMSEISRLFDAIQAVDELYLPVEKGNEVEFGLYSADAKVRLDALQTVKSAKGYVLPVPGRSDEIPYGRKEDFCRGSCKEG